MQRLKTMHTLKGSNRLKEGIDLVQAVYTEALKTAWQRDLQQNQSPQLHPYNGIIFVLW